MRATHGWTGERSGLRPPAVCPSQVPKPAVRPSNQRPRAGLAARQGSAAEMSPPSYNQGLSVYTRWCVMMYLYKHVRCIDQAGPHACRRCHAHPPGPPSPDETGPVVQRSAISAQPARGSPAINRGAGPAAPCGRTSRRTISHRSVRTVLSPLRWSRRLSHVASIKRCAACNLKRMQQSAQVPISLGPRYYLCVLCTSYVLP